MNSTGECSEPILGADFESVAYEFHYFCNSASKVKMSISLQMIGIMFGAMTFGQLSDMFGRRAVNYSSFKLFFELIIKLI
uniref:Bm59 n=1 Tax=Brugia malayi TaxID=6279 RepID=A0A0H5S120_BRUMA|nr:Bm59 [Brugia malayi]